MKAIEDFWNPIDWEDEDTFPPADTLVLMSFSNDNETPRLGRCRGSEEDGYAMYIWFSNIPCAAVGLFVNAWMPLPKCYRGEEER